MFSRTKDLSHMSSISGLRSRFKNSMSSSAKIRSSEGCWTCRLRRKKCDEARPVCDGCAQLEITCYYSDTKPDWMDGGERQKEMADSLKKQVKIQANNRRERKYLQGLDVDGNLVGGSEDGDHGIPPVPALSADGGSSKATDSNSPSTVNDTPGDSSSPPFQMNSVKSSINEIAPGASPNQMRQLSPEWTNHSSPPAAASASPPAPTTLPASHPSVPISADQSNPTPPFADDSNLSFIMIYLDYVFPFLFPFYKPALLEGGRGWLLNVLNHNKALYHTALGLSSHFFGVVLNGAQVEHAPCRMKSVASLQHQLDLALRELRADMARINEGDVEDRLRQGCRVLESIVQLLIFDVTLASTDHWHMHLDAATVVFQQILPQPDHWDPTMQHMAIPLLSDVHFPPGSHKPWSSDQAALRFFTASLLYFDIISATALERPPSLQGYHQHLLSPRKEECLEIEPRLRLEEYFGCQSWVLQLIGEIATLDAWKKETRRAGSLSMTHLVSRAACLELALREGIACMDNQCPQLMGSDELTSCAGSCSMTDYPPPHPTHVDTTRLPPDPLTLYQHQQTRDTVEASKVHTKIWAYAALTYLSTVVSGWQPSCPETMTSVQATLDLLNSLHSPVCLRTAVWPFCVIGCLADPCQEHMFREMVGKMGPLEVFGSIKAALGVMENVWARRDTIDESWDLAACFKVLGHAVLLT
ncbi:transcriptional regulatory protein ume6 [Colletotrichum tofieldiae]|uniref:Transcriptional regulatory protein ume6 n=1 Tax=Colletotrichum tofieldiae TaxID=708197 RepID=A0A166V4Y8_9PEZI|nr:transcriptional regulatory protein ume6 [Colletotrichum tofieldiae]GKT64289.1 transcriptional regulatory protein ume6 [Colletotrichum tofieldiae]GKT74264.1 transcriptional regulatory protein ume6 [Colletotrichum tofieldiae]